MPNTAFETVMRYNTENLTILNEKGYPNKYFAENVTFGDFYLLQVYKIRKSLNTSLVVERLGKTNFLQEKNDGLPQLIVGVWDLANNTKNLSPFKIVEKRQNVYNFPILFGRKNASQKLINAIDENVVEDDNDEYNLVEIMDYIIKFINGT